MIKKLSHRLEQLDYLLRTKATGNPTELATKLGISERAWFKFRDELVNEMHVPLAYCPILRSYYYTAAGKIEIGFKRLDDNKKEHLRGGTVYRTHGTFFNVFGYL